MNALIYHPDKKWRFGTALTAAAALHLAGIRFATTQKEAPPSVCQGPGELTEIFFVPQDRIPDPLTEPPDPLPTPPQTDPNFLEVTSLPPPVRTLRKKPVDPIAREPNNASRGLLNLSTARVFAVSAPRPEYPYEARRQKITGEGVAAMTVDPASGQVSGVSM